MSNDIVRAYPIRTTRCKWDIKLYKYHECSSRCNINFINDPNTPNQILITYNPKYENGKCEKSKQLEQTLVQISEFNTEDCSIDIGSNEILYNPDIKVIPDTFFTLNVYYPLSNVFEILMKTDSPSGFTLRELLNNIKYLYEFIYAEEERTATPQVYRMQKHCQICVDSDMSVYINQVLPVNIECCICYTEYNTDETVSSLRCKHTFHSECINTWLKSSETCPICRTNVKVCDGCDGSGIIEYEFSGIVIPIHERGNNLNRNSTNGIFGIHDCDLEDLLIERLRYDRTNKRLYLNIIS